MDDLMRDLLRALRNAPNSDLDHLADAVGMPRTNFGRRVESRLREPLDRLVADGLVEAGRSGRYRLSESGRRTLNDG